MQISNEHQAAQVSGVSSRGFGFEMNAKMYDILISKMYTNKPGAVIRELSSNAWDAHKEAGMEEVPFDLHLPTWLDKFFYLRDYGTGIPHHKFEDIYTNVGASTKEGSNELIGGFGLGSKTPFTMTDTFMVENWYAGVKSTWICFKDKGEPQVAKVAEEPSDEQSGLKVSFSFDEGDVPEFTKQVSKQLRFFPVKPKITGGEGRIEFLKLPNDWDTKEYFYTHKGGTGGDYSDNYLIMGHVSYLLKDSEFDYNLRSVFRNGLTIKVPIGSVDVPPSRENLEMTPKTKAYVTGVLNRIKDSYINDTQVSIDKCVNEWDLRKVVHSLNSDLISGHTGSFIWKGLPMVWGDFSRGSISSVTGYSVRILNRAYKSPYMVSSIPVGKLIDGRAALYVNDLGVGASKHIKDVYKNFDTKNMYIFHVSGLTVKNKDAEITQAIADLTTATGENILLLSSVLGFPPQKVKGVAGTSKVTNQVFSILQNVCPHTSLKNQLTEEDTLPTNGYYVELHTWSLRSDISNIRRVLDLGLLRFLDKPLYAVRTKTIKKLDPSMVLLSVDSLRWLQPVLVQQYKQDSQLTHVKNNVHIIPETHKQVFSVIHDKKLKAYGRYAAYVHRKLKVDSSFTLDIHRTLFDTGITFTALTSTKLNSLYEKYDPIHDTLSSVCCSWDSNRNVKRIKSIVDLININK